MEFKDIIKKAKAIKERYDQINQKKWEATEYTQGLVGDVGDLTKLISAKNGFRKIEDVDQKLKHEISDCLWSIIMVAEALDINLEQKFIKNMDELKIKIDKHGQ